MRNAECIDRKTAPVGTIRSGAPIRNCCECLPALCPYGFTKPVCAGATFSRDHCYRYDLRRVLRGYDDRTNCKLVNFVLLNPSTADENKNDATLVRCTNYACDWGYDALVVTNLFALRSTHPKRLRAGKPVGPSNDEFLVHWATASDRVVVGWGNHGVLHDRGQRVTELLRKYEIELHCLGTTCRGQPHHPLRLSGALKPRSYE